MISKIFSAIGGYALITLLQGLVSFLSVPVTIKALSKEDFIFWSLTEPVVIISANILLIGFNYGAIKNLASRDLSNIEILSIYIKRQIYFSLLLLIAVSPISALIIGNVNLKYIFCVSLAIFFESIVAFFLAYNRGVNNKKMFFAIAAPKILLISAFYFYLYITKEKISINTLIFVYLASYVPSFIGIYLRKNIVQLEKNVNSDTHKKVVFYGLPILLSSISSMVVSNADRFIVNNIFNNGDALSYIVAAKISGLINFAAAPINMWWPSVRFKNFSTNKERDAYLNKNIIAVLFYYCATLIFSVYIIPKIYPWYSGGENLDKKICFVLLFSGVVAAFNPIVSIGNMKDGKTIYILYSSLVSGFLGLTCTYFGALMIGPLGAAMGVFAGQVAAITFSIYSSQKNEYVNIDWCTIAIVLMVSLLLIKFIA